MAIGSGLFCWHLEFFHGANNIEQTIVHHSTELLIFDTGNCRAHTGATRPCDLSGDRAQWQAWLDGDVWGVHIEHLQKRADLHLMQLFNRYDASAMRH